MILNHRARRVPKTSAKATSYASTEKRETPFFTFFHKRTFLTFLTFLTTRCLTSPLLF